VEKETHGSWGCGATAGGSGGITTGALEGSGAIRANGGRAYVYAGAGGGGRIAVYGNRDNFSETIEVLGGYSYAHNGAYAGQDGAVYLSP